MDFIALITAASPAVRMRLHRDLIRQAPAFGRCVVSLVDVRPNWPIDPAMGNLDQAPACDAVIEWSSEAEDGGGILAQPLAGTAAVHRYRVERIPEHGKPAVEQGAVPGIKLVSPWAAYPGLDLEAIRQRWQRHAAFVKEVQWGASRYERLICLSNLDAGSPVYTGFTLMHFAAEDDLVLRQYDSPEAAYAVLEDSSDFMAEDWIFYCSEYRFG